jgi:predicted CXXCH cytochrome family protein
VKPEGELCASCHRAGGAASAPKHEGFDVGKLGCASCHDPHSGADKSLLRKFAHSVVSDCSTCHQKDAKLTLTDKQPSLCFTCHGDQQEELKKAVVHDPFKEGTCTTCHTPHASTQKGLLAASQKDLCGTCHDIVSADLARKSVHKPFREGACTSCHQPHASANKRLLKAEGAALCATCHADSKEWGTRKVAHPPSRRASA